MKLRIIVEVVDEKTRKGTRRRREVEIPGRILNVHKALCESRRDLRAFVADDVMSAAIGSVSSQQSTVDGLSEALLTEPSPQRQSQPIQVTQNRAPQRTTHNKVESFLGLDVIEHMDGLDSRAKDMERAQEAQAAAHAAAAGLPPESKFEWGAIGYGPDRGK